ncbi:MAG TPA: metallophosphoesterase [Thermohalobaculum sp.]|nr:metallophosphoesterase [Thermohalobaculum sp.]
MRFLILSDLHLVPPGAPLYGLDPLASLARAVELIVREHADAGFLVLMGDLAHAGEAAAYAALAEALALLPMPVIPLTGNHDTRAGVAAAFPDAPRDAHGFIEALQVFAEASVLTLDTLDEASTEADGVLCPARLAFLAQALAEAPADRPLLLLQHHPPMRLGLPGMDRIRLRNPEDEWAVIARGRRPDYLICGHVHRPVAGVWRGIPFHVQRGLAHQIAFGPVAPEEGNRGTHEPPDLGIVEIGPGGIRVHQRPIRYDGPVFRLRDPVAARARRLP